jgi:hypothetical protein
MPEGTPVDSGYLHGKYAESFRENGAPVFLSSCGAWLLRRGIPGTSLADAIALYPILCCRDWSRLANDLASLRDLVSITAVADPFGADEPLLRQCFPDFVVRFKRHFVTDTTQDPREFVAAGHRRNARKALRALRVERCEDPPAMSDEWTALYRNLIRRHSIRGIAAFSADALRLQLATPGLILFRALHGDETVGMAHWMITAGVAYYHLAAYSDPGYRHGASFALFWESLHWFAAAGIRWLSLGGAPGEREGPPCGLTRFKLGWSTGTRPAYVCGRILDSDAYRQLAAKAGAGGDPYFPAYRRPEGMEQDASRA